MIAHRGVSVLECKNICPAFVVAGNRSCYGIENDIRVIKDGSFIAMHDDTAEKVSLGACNISIFNCNYTMLRRRKCIAQISCIYIVLICKKKRLVDTSRFLMK